VADIDKTGTERIVLRLVRRKGRGKQKTSTEGHRKKSFKSTGLLDRGHETSDRSGGQHPGRPITDAEDDGE